MKLHELSPAEGSKKASKRIGRGAASGQGKTAGKGHKGQKARAGKGVRAGFEGGQMPLQRRLPKFGFNNNNRIEYKAINISVLEALAAKHNLTTINVDTLVEAGMASKNDRIKILGNGVLNTKLEVTAHAFSKSAIAAIEAKQGQSIKL